MVRMRLLKKQFTSKTRLNKWIQKKIAETYERLSQDQDLINKIDDELNPFNTKEEIHNYLTSIQSEK